MRQEGRQAQCSSPVGGAIRRRLSGKAWRVNNKIKQDMLPGAELHLPIFWSQRRAICVAMGLYFVFCVLYFVFCIFASDMPLYFSAPLAVIPHSVHFFLSVYLCVYLCE